MIYQPYFHTFITPTTHYMSFRTLYVFLFLLLASIVQAQTLDSIPNFVLKDVVSGENITFNDYKGSKATVVIFTSNFCPYSQLYEQRIKALSEEYTPKGVSFMLINSNNSNLSKNESETNMIVKAKDSGFGLPYFSDKDLVAKNIFEAEKTPEVFIVAPDNKGKLVVAYHGAIDDNPQSPDEVEDNYVKRALNNLIIDKVSPVKFERPTGCRIKIEN